MTRTPTDPSSRKTAVVIPYYQEEPGILRRAVISALAQEGVSNLEIIVVDDGSPAPARADLQGLDLPAHVTLKLIEQPNRGPGAARNRGLDGVAQDTVYVAFLDSDDRWTRTHLENALRALDTVSDLYFSDYGNSDTSDTHFERRDFDTGRHECIDPENTFIVLSVILILVSHRDGVRFQLLFIDTKNLDICVFQNLFASVKKVHFYFGSRAAYSELFFRHRSNVCQDPAFTYSRARGGALRELFGRSASG